MTTSAAQKSGSESLVTGSSSNPALAVSCTPAATKPAPSTWHIILMAGSSDGPAAAVRVRRMLKSCWRAYRLKCVEAREITQKTPETTPSLLAREIQDFSEKCNRDFLFHLPRCLASVWVFITDRAGANGITTTRHAAIASAIESEERYARRHVVALVALGLADVLTPETAASPLRIIARHPREASADG